MYKNSQPLLSLLNLSKLLSLRLLFVLLFVGSFLFGFTSPAHAFSCSSAQTGNFNAAATWTGCNNTTPQITDTITVNNGHAVTLVATTTTAGITINAGGVLDTNTRAIVNTGNFVNNGSVTGTTATLALSGSGTTIDGSGTYSPTGTITITNNKTINASANLSFPGAITISTGTTTNSGTISVTGVLTITGTMTNNGTVTTNGTLTGAGSWTQGTNSVLNAGGGTTNAMAITTVNFSSNVNTVNYKANATQTCKVTQYYHLQMSGTSAKTCAITAAVLGNVTVSGTATWTHTTAITVNGNLIISGGTLTTGAVAFAVTGTTTVSSGTLSLTNNTGAKTLIGLVTISGGTMSGASTGIVFRNGIAQSSGTVSITGTATLNTNNQTFDGTISITTLTVATGITLTNNGTLTTAGVFTVTGSVTNNGTVTTNSTLTGAGSWMQGTDAILNAGGGTTNAVAVTTVNFSSNVNTVNYKANAIQTCKVTQYYHLQFTGTSAKTCAITAAVLGNVTMSGTATWTHTTAVTVNGNLTISGGTLTTGAVVFTVNGTTTVSSGTLSLTSNTGAKTLVGLVTVSGGTLSGASTGIVFRGGVTQTSGTVSITGIATFNTNAQTLNGTMSISTIIVASGITLTNNSSGIITVPSTFTVTGSVINNGTINASSTLTGGGSWTQGINAILNASGGTTNAMAVTTVNFNSNENTVNYAANAAQTCKITQYHHLQFTGTTAKTCALTSPILGDLTVGGAATWTHTTAVTVNGDLVISGGTLTTGAVAFTIDGTTTITSGILSLTNNTGTKLLKEMVTLDGGTLSGASTAIQLNSGITNNAGAVSITGTVTLTTAGTLFAGANTISIGALTVNNPATVINNGNVAITGTFNGSGSWLQGNNATLSVGGSTTNAIAITTIDTSTNPNTVIYSSTTASQTIKDIPYNNLTINKLGQIATLEGDTSVEGNLTITNGTLNTNASGNYDLQIKGDWSNADTFIPNSSTVTFDSMQDQTINNSNTWYGLEITGGDRTIFFQNTTTQTIAANGSLTLTGTSGNLLTLAPLSPASTWNLAVNNTNVTQDVSFVSVSYSDASGGTYINASDGTNTDNGNNTNWLIIVSISMDDTGSIDLGTMGLGSMTDTTASGVNDGRVITVDNGPATLTIKSTNFINGGDTWTLGPTNGADTAKWEFSNNGTDWTTFVSPDPSTYTLDSNVTQGATRNLFLRMTMPTTATLFTDHSATVTVMASAP